MVNGITNDEINTIVKFIEDMENLQKEIKPGKIVIIDNKVKFEYYKLEKPINPGIDGSFSEDINYIKDVEKFIASKRVIEVSNYKIFHGKSKDFYIILNKEEVFNNQPCEAEVNNNVAIIIKIN